MRTSYFNIYLDVLNTKEALEMCYYALTGKVVKTVFFVNAHCFNVAQNDTLYQNVLLHGDMVLNDGIGISLGSFLAGLKFKENLNGTDFIPHVIKMAADWNKKVFFIGGLEGVALKAKEKVESSFVDIQIVGVQNGYFSNEKEKEIIEQINFSHADILIVGMGVPRQEIWIDSIKSKLSSVKLCIAGGAIFDFLSGHINRAPYWMRKYKIEWIYRLYLEPKRMWKRYLIGNFIFFINVFKYLLKTRISARISDSG